MKTHRILTAVFFYMMVVSALLGADLTITTNEQLMAIADNLNGNHVLAADLDLEYSDPAYLEEGRVGEYDPNNGLGQEPNYGAGELVKVTTETTITIYRSIGDVPLGAFDAQYWVFEFRHIIAGPSWRSINLFTGAFDGQGHAIRNLYSKGVAGVRANGLFGTGTTGTIKNLKLVDAVIDGVGNNEAGYSSYNAGIAAELGNAGVIENCQVSGTFQGKADGIESSTKFVYVGTIGGACHGTIRNCKASGTVKVGGDDTDSGGIKAGGIVGYQTGDTSIVGCVVNCTSTAKITNLDGDTNIDVPITFIGGIAGQVGKTNNNANINYISGCRFLGEIDFTTTVETRQTRIGGIVGVNASLIEKSAAICSIQAASPCKATSTSRLTVGGLVGIQYNNNGAGVSITRECYADCDMSIGHDSGSQRVDIGGIVGVIGGDADQTQEVSNCFAKGSFADSTQTPTSTITTFSCGGFAGQCTYATITNVYAAMDAYGGTGTFICGFAGYSASYTFSGCYWDSQSSGRATDYTGSTATAKTTIQMWSLLFSSASGFNGVTVWRPDYFWQNGGYPVLRCFDGSYAKPYRSRGRW